MTNFLAQFFDGTTHNIELRTLPHVNRIFSRDLKALEQFTESNSTTNIYFGCTTRENENAKKQGCRELVAFFIDVDFKETTEAEARAALIAFPFPPSVTINSGGGLHTYWLLKEPHDAQDPACEKILKGLALACKGDTQATDINRILRLPETFNYKYKPQRKVIIEKADWDLRYNFSDFELYEISDKKPELVEERNGKVKKGSRTKALIQLAGFMNRNGNTHDEAEAALAGLNSRFDPPFTDAEVRRKLKSIFDLYKDQHGANGNGNAIDRVIELVVADSIEPEPLLWLWENRIPQGKLTVFCGVPDTGKSTVAIDIAARCTTGRCWPDSDRERTPVHVLMLVSEDDLSDTVVPRLIASGADLSKVHFAIQTVVTDKKSGNRVARRIALDQDMKSLEGVLSEHPEIKLIIADPLGSYLGKLKKNAEEDIRLVLTELKEMSERTKTAMISIDHFNKNVDQAAIHRLAGAGALAAVPRAVWGFLKDKEDPEKMSRLMLNLKLNVVSEAKKTGMKYRAKGVEFSIRDVQSSVPVIEWLGASTGDIDELLHEKPDAEKSKVGKCAEWLRERLQKNKGHEFCSVIYSEAEQFGWNSKLVQRATGRAEVTWDKAGSRSVYKLITMREPGEEEI